MKLSAVRSPHCTGWELFPDSSVLITSAIYNRLTVGTARVLAARHLLIVLMLLLTLISQFAIAPKMHALRAQAGVIDNVQLDSPPRMEFDRLHIWSEKFEEGVFVLGLATLFLTARDCTRLRTIQYPKLWSCLLQRPAQRRGGCIAGKVCLR